MTQDEESDNSKINSFVSEIVNHKILAKLSQLHVQLVTPKILRIYIKRKTKICKPKTQLKFYPNNMPKKHQKIAICLDHKFD